MPDIPPESVTEEEYVDENGHTVVKKVLARGSIQGCFHTSYANASTSVVP